MKFWTFLFTALIPLFVFFGCEPTEQEKMLEGHWLGRVTETDSDGNRIIYKISFEFNRERDYMGYFAIIELSGYGDLVAITYSGDWLADEEEILMFPDEDTLEIEFAEELEYYCRIMGMSWSDFSYVMEAATSKEIEGIMSIPIISLKCNELRTSIEGESLTLYKQL